MSRLSGTCVYAMISENYICSKACNSLTSRRTDVNVSCILGKMPIFFVVSLNLTSWRSYLLSISQQPWAYCEALEYFLFSVESDMMEIYCDIAQFSKHPYTTILSSNLELRCRLTNWFDILHHRLLNAATYEFAAARFVYVKVLPACDPPISRFNTPLPHQRLLPGRETAGSIIWPIDRLGEYGCTERWGFYDSYVGSLRWRLCSFLDDFWMTDSCASTLTTGCFWRRLYPSCPISRSW